MKPRKHQLDFLPESKAAARKGGKPAGPCGEWLMYIDGAARGNPGPAAAAAVLYDPAGRKITETAFALGELTNNAAEYEALRRGLIMAREKGVPRIEIRSDSELLVKQLQGTYRIRSEHLKTAASEIRSIAAEFQAVRYTAIPRELNRAADRLANKALDEYLSTKTTGG